LYKGDTRHYFPNNPYKEEMTKKEIGNSFYGAFAHKKARLKKERTMASLQRVSLRVSLFCCPDLNTYWFMA